MVRISKWFAPVLATGVCLGAGLAAAGTVQLEQLPGGRIAIEAREASTGEIVKSLGEAYGFKFERLGEGPNGDTRSGRYEGTIRGVLARVLENDSHIIVNSSTTKAGIARITLYGASQSPATPANPGAVAANPGPAPVSRQLTATPPPPARPAPQPSAALPQQRTAVAPATAVRPAANPAVQPPAAARAPEPQQRRRGGVIN